MVCRVAVHHFQDPARAVREMARVTGRLVVIEDTLVIDRLVQEAERLRDATHASHCSREEFVRMLAEAGFHLLAEAVFT